MATSILMRREERFSLLIPMGISGQWETAMGRTFSMKRPGQERLPKRCLVLLRVVLLVMALAVTIALRKLKRLKSATVESCEAKVL